MIHSDAVKQRTDRNSHQQAPKGRAKKRITYTRRFVNVQLTGGKRKVRNLSPASPGVRWVDD